MQKVYEVIKELLIQTHDKQSCLLLDAPNHLTSWWGSPDKQKTNMTPRQQHVFSRSRLTTGHFGIGVLLQVSVQDGIADLVADLVCGEAIDGEAGDLNAWRLKDVTFVFLEGEKWHVTQQSLRAAGKMLLFFTPLILPYFSFSGEKLTN